MKAMETPVGQATDGARGESRAPSAERLLGRVRGARSGPTLVAIGGLHGNEPSGITAARQLVSELAPLAPRLRGEVVAFAGNRGALARGVRFIHRDLNRRWATDPLRAIAAEDGAGGIAEDREQRELLQALEAVRRDARGPLVLIDLHTTSAPGAPFVLPGASRASVAFALHLPLTVILGLQERLDGVLANYLARRGWTAISVEGGPHDGEASPRHHLAALWVALVSGGMLAESDVPGLAAHRALLDAARGPLPHAVRVTRRHVIQPNDQFRMEPGFSNLQRVRAGDLLARDRRGDIRAPSPGILLMPLYQALGDDGFFFAVEVSRWLLRARAAIVGMALPRRRGHTGPTLVP